ncbi:type VI secretion system baseplate subunit TssG [Paraburkholderia aspalathi]|uniref:type VI secretion system baseplate subunit TssG n=1 Tax=Paraburkholderia aspalathi TaxID=1324617 RepID=UPI0038BD6A00
MDSYPTPVAPPRRSPLQPGQLRAWFDHQSPWQASFLSLLRAIAARTPLQPFPGTALLPSEESFRIGQQPSMAFAPREVATLDVNDGRLGVRLFGLGVWGPQGPLPLHITELAYSRAESHRDHALIDFVNLFHHRALALFYRAWASSQATVSLDRPNGDSFSFYIASLIGIDPAESGDFPLPAHARYAAAAHLIREARNPEGISSTLANYFKVPVAVEQYIAHWIQISRSERCHIGVPEASAIMGEGALLGDMIPDCQHKFRLVVGPLDLDQYLRLTPHGDDLPTLVDWVRTFVGHEYNWEVMLLVKPHAAPAVSTNSTHRLGYSTWLGQSDSDRPVIGMVFEPENITS